MPNRLKARFFPFILLAIGLLPGCKKPLPAGPSGSVTLVFTAQTHGRLTPCGCFTGQYGGLTRLKTALNDPALAEAVGLDVGDALEGTEDFHLLKYRQVIRAYALMHYAALNVGHREAGLSATTLRQLAKDSPVPLVSANLLDRATHRPLLPAWTVIERAGRRIAFVGVVDPKGLDDTLGEGLAVERMETCLSRILPELKRSADVFVLLAFTDEGTLTSLAKQFYEFRVILGGKVSQPAPELLAENQSLIYYTANESKSFGALQLIFDQDGKSEAGPHAVTLLHDKFVQDDQILGLAAAYRHEVRTTPLAIDDPAHAQADHVPGTHASGTYVGSESCLGCHASAAQVWQQSGHGHAFEVLVQREADADPSCIGCHTVGFGSPSGYRREFGKTKLTDVGCESCHGPGSTHVAQRQSGAPATFHFRPLGAGDCQTCHHGEFSRPFDWAKFWPEVKHGKEKR